MSDNQVIPEAAQRAAEAAYTEKLVELRLAEGGGFKVASQQRRAIAFALEAAAPHMLGGEVVGDIERIAPNTLRAGDTVSHNGILYIRSTAGPESDLDCQRCDLDMHVCGGCGEPLRHDGKQFNGTKHEACT